MWAVDARDGFHGGGAGTRWVTDDDEAAAVAAELALMGERVRIMPFLEGIATSVHGIVLPDGVVALRPVEMVTLRRGHELRYSGCATFWDPPDEIREEMRDVHGASANGCAPRSTSAARSRSTAWRRRTDSGRRS